MTRHPYSYEYVQQCMEVVAKVFDVSPAEVEKRLHRPPTDDPGRCAKVVAEATGLDERSATLAGNAIDHKKLWIGKPIMTEDEAFDLRDRLWSYARLLEESE